VRPNEQRPRFTAATNLANIVAARGHSCLLFAVQRTADDPVSRLREVEYITGVRKRCFVGLISANQRRTKNVGRCWRHRLFLIGERMR